MPPPVMPTDATPRPSVAPPPWTAALLRAALPDDPMRDAIVGDLHEELARDAAAVGDAWARVAYRRRVAGIVCYAAVDALRWRRWASSTPPAPAARRRASSARRGDVGLAALALGVLAVGIVVNTLLFDAVHQGPRPAAVSPTVSSALGVGAVALSLGCAAVAAVLLCAGPRWLRRRSRR